MLKTKGGLYEQTGSKSYNVKASTIFLKFGTRLPDLIYSVNFCSSYQNPL